MAGIGFELRRLFARKGMIASVRAYSYAAVVCTGPMLLGFDLLLLSSFLVAQAGGSRQERELLVSMINHTLLASLIMGTAVNMTTTRFCADMLYEGNYDAIMPSFYGSIGIMLVLGGAAYGIFLAFSGVWVVYRVLCWIFFMILTVTWTQMGYLTMLKDVRSIILGFGVSVVFALTVGWILIFKLQLPPVLAMLSAICLGYCCMMIWFFGILYRSLPKGSGSCMRFLEWFDKTPEIGLIGLFNVLGMFGHMLIAWWLSPLQMQVEGLFFCAPGYDVPAIIAYFSILITTINFTTTVETRFYPCYREYFDLFNHGGSIENIRESEEAMIQVLGEEIGYLSVRQIFSTMLFMILGTIMIQQLPFGFDSRMLQTYRCLCVGYAFYAIGNSLMLILQYFSDMRGAFFSAGTFFLLTNGLTLLFTASVEYFYGMGFLLGSAAYALVAVMRLCSYLNKLKYHILVHQPLLSNAHAKLFSRIADWAENRAYNQEHEEE